jgi:formate dehydrogenase iron-sulfur subunit
MGKQTMLIDAAKCTACRGCQVACKRWNGLTAQKTHFTGTYENPISPSGSTWSEIAFNEVSRGGKVLWLFLKRQCMHCGDPGCMKSCPVPGAIRKDPDTGAVVFDDKLCSGCKYCISFCPFEIPKFHKESQTAKKCTFCFDRITNGLRPACVETCLSGSLDFGPHEDMMAKAEKRLGEIGKDHPEANIYGDKVMGGLGVLYLLPFSPALYGLPLNPEAAWYLPYWKEILKPVGAFAIGFAVVSSGLSWLLSLRNKASHQDAASVDRGAEEAAAGASRPESKEKEESK